MHQESFDGIELTEKFAFSSLSYFFIPVLILIVLEKRKLEHSNVLDEAERNMIILM